MIRKKLKDFWKEMTPVEKALVSIRDMASVCMMITALLHVLGILPYGATAAWFLPVIAISQAMLSWKHSKATSLFFLLGLIFFLFVFFLSKG